jgi:hypothetical protein
MKGRGGLPALALLLLCAGCSVERFVESIVIDNPTAYTANVDVRGGARDGWLGLTASKANSEKTVELVYDQGPTWIFRFSYAGYEEELELSRSELVHAGWRVEVPESFETMLREHGVQPPP